MKNSELMREREYFYSAWRFQALALPESHEKRYRNTHYVTSHIISIVKYYETLDITHKGARLVCT